MKMVEQALQRLALDKMIELDCKPKNILLISVGVYGDWEEKLQRACGRDSGLFLRL